MYGEGGNGYINGRYGEDTIYGGSGNDTLLGDDSTEYMFEGSDYLYGGNGRDYIYGGDGQDTLLGGAGNDTLVGAELRDFVYTGTGSDEIQVHNELNGKQDIIYDFNLNHDVIGTTTVYSNISSWYDPSFGAVIVDTSTNYHIAILDGVNYASSLNSSHFTNI